MIILFVAVRFGLVAFAALASVTVIFGFTPITFQVSWYAGYGYAALLLIAALALYGFKTSLGGRPALSFAAMEGEPGSRSTIYVIEAYVSKDGVSKTSERLLNETTDGSRR